MVTKRVGCRMQSAEFFLYHFSNILLDRVGSNIHMGA
jgi:hypothetical protein